MSGDANSAADPAAYPAAPEEAVEPARPLLRVVGGSPSAEELAALTAVVSALGAGGGAPPERVRRGGWNDPAAQHQRMPIPGPNAWLATFHR